MAANTSTQWTVDVFDAMMDLFFPSVLYCSVQIQHAEQWHFSCMLGFCSIVTVHQTLFCMWDSSVVRCVGLVTERSQVQIPAWVAGEFSSPGCMVYTELAPRWQQFHVAPAMPALKYTTLVDIQKTCYKKLVTHVEPHASTVSQLKRAENSTV